MSQKLLISAGFAGMDAALSAARQHETSRASIQDLTLVFPTPTLMGPPRSMSRIQRRRRPCSRPLIPNATSTCRRRSDGHEAWLVR